MIPGSPGTAPLRHLLTTLAEAGSTGALHVDGPPGGTWYLVAGRITHASSPACPDVGERLVGSGRLSAKTWQAAYDAGHADHSVGQRLVQAGHLLQGELVCRVLATICDVTHALLQSDSCAVRFVPGERHWLGTVTQIELTALSRETARRRLLAAPTVETPLTLQDLEPDAPWAGQGRAGNTRPATVDMLPPQPATPRVPNPDAVPQQTGTLRPANTGPAAVGHAPQPATEARTGNGQSRPDGQNSRFVEDYARLKRIRRSLTSIN
ncbi:MAG TPA: DUF4388 domain-containing protein [Actinoplanes sp.]|nr:DUF4388 domain-containing protein [Actinoplanes sp.]